MLDRSCSLSNRVQYDLLSNAVGLCPSGPAPRPQWTTPGFRCKLKHVNSRNKRASRPVHRILAASLAIGSALASPFPCVAGEIEVRLFGQPCKLSGPQDTATLKAVHAVSPEQAVPDDLLTEFRADRANQLKNSLEKVKAASPLPSSLDRYRDKLKRRLIAMIAFFEGFSVARKDRKPEPMSERVSHSLSPQDLESFGSLVRKAFSASAGKPISNEAGEQLFVEFLQRIEADPEEDFHRATRKLQVTYDCAMGEPDDE